MIYLCLFIRNGYKDEPENGVEVEENVESDDDYKYKSAGTSDFKDDVDDDDDFQPRKSETKAPTSPSTKKTPTKKIDLGAAANFTGSDNAASASNTNNDFADFSSFPSTGQAAQPKKSSNDLDDLLGGPLSEPLQPAGGTTSGGNVDLFGDFSSPGE